MMSSEFKFGLTNPLTAFDTIVFFVSEGAIIAESSHHASRAYPMPAIYAVVSFIAGRAIRAQPSHDTAGTNPLTTFDTIVFFVSEGAIIAESNHYACHTDLLLDGQDISVHLTINIPTLVFPAFMMWIVAYLIIFGKKKNLSNQAVGVIIFHA